MDKAIILGGVRHNNPNRPNGRHPWEKSSKKLHIKKLDQRKIVASIETAFEIGVSEVRRSFFVVIHSCSVSSLRFVFVLIRDNITSFREP
jgi:hypothetical protein